MAPLAAPVRYLLLAAIPLLLAGPAIAADGDATTDLGPIDNPVASALLDLETGVPLTLDEAIAGALAFNADIVAQYQLIEAARAQVRQAKSNYLPHLDATYQGRETHTFPDPTLPAGSEELADSFSNEDWINQVHIDLVQPIPIFGTQQLLVHLANLGVDSAEARLESTRQSVRAQVVRAWYS
ncbi:MAG: TolC family protein, partial [bacterium]